MDKLSSLLPGIDRLELPHAAFDGAMTTSLSILALLALRTIWKRTEEDFKRTLEKLKLDIFQAATLFYVGIALCYLFVSGNFLSAVVASTIVVLADRAPLILHSRFRKSARPFLGVLIILAPYIGVRTESLVREKDKPGTVLALTSFAPEQSDGHLSEISLGITTKLRDLLDELLPPSIQVVPSQPYTQQAFDEWHPRSLGLRYPNISPRPTAAVFGRLRTKEAGEQVVFSALIKLYSSKSSLKADFLWRHVEYGSEADLAFLAVKLAHAFITAPERQPVVRLEQADESNALDALINEMEDLLALRTSVIDAGFPPVNDAANSQVKRALIKRLIDSYGESYLQTTTASLRRDKVETQFVALGVSQ